MFLKYAEIYAEKKDCMESKLMLSFVNEAFLAR